MILFNLVTLLILCTLFPLIKTETADIDYNDLIPLNGLQRLALQIRGQNATASVRAFIQLRRILCDEEDPPINQVLNNGLLPDIMKRIHISHASLQAVAVRSLSVISSKNTTLSTQLINNATVPRIIKLLKSSDPYAVNQTLTALVKLFEIPELHRKIFVEFGLVDPLTKLINKNAPQDRLQNVAVLIFHLFKQRNLPPLEDIVKVVPKLRQIIHKTKNSVAFFTALVVNSILEDGHLDLIINEGLVPDLIVLLQNEDETLVRTGLAALTRIAKGDVFQMQKVVDTDIFGYLREFIVLYDDDIKEDALTLLTALSNGTSVQIQGMIEYDVLPILISLMEHGNKPMLRVLSLLVLKQFSRNGIKRQIEVLIKHNPVRALCLILSWDITISNQYALQVLDFMLEKAPEHRPNVLQQLSEQQQCRGMIRKMANDEDEEVSTLAIRLITKKLVIKKTDSETLGFYWLCVALDRLGLQNVFILIGCIIIGQITFAWLQKR